jgi:hypothetical protein
MYNTTTIPLKDFTHVTSAGLTFTMQKKGILGDISNLLLLSCLLPDLCMTLVMLT